jgi:hypothetical protein
MKIPANSHCPPFSKQRSGHSGTVMRRICVVNESI